MFTRFKLWLLTLLIAIDQFGQVFLSGPKYIFFGGKKPNADETISSKVGRKAIEGKRWALISEKIIDTVFEYITGQPNHCRSKIGR